VSVADAASAAPEATVVVAVAAEGDLVDLAAEGGLVDLAAEGGLVERAAAAVVQAGRAGSPGGSQ
jgi:hypothetical protein